MRFQSKTSFSNSSGVLSVDGVKLRVNSLRVANLLFPSLILMTEHCGQESFRDFISKQSSKEKYSNFSVQFLGQKTFRALKDFGFWPKDT